MNSLEGYFTNLAAAVTNEKELLNQLVLSNTTLTNTKHGRRGSLLTSKPTTRRESRRKPTGAIPSPERQIPPPFQKPSSLSTHSTREQGKT